MPTAYYSDTIEGFLAAAPDAVAGRLATESSTFAIEPSQMGAWVQQIIILQQALQGLTGTIHFEFVVPRIGSRLDVALIMRDSVFVLEFKVGERRFPRRDIHQVWDYALDLKNFHKGSHSAPIFPILVATAATQSDPSFEEAHLDGVHPPACCGAAGLRALLEDGLARSGSTHLDGGSWADSPYLPTPTIIDAARALFAGHTVAAIARTDADAPNLSATTASIEAVIRHAQSSCTKALVLVTGVPGAGKTLVGLSVATARRDKESPTHAVYLSGNGPLIAVLHEALVRDALQRERTITPGVRKGDVAQRVKPFIQNVHHFRDAGVVTTGAPSDRIVIFDEAQRAWDEAMTTAFMTRRGHPEFASSEPAFLLSCMDRHPDWAVVICLIGGGQEINHGEAGIKAWLEAVRDKLPHWEVYMSPNLHDREYAAEAVLPTLTATAQVRYDSTLHLAVPMRSFRSENVSTFVKALLDRDPLAASQAHRSFHPNYPVYVTRSLERGKDWVRKQARGSERFGLLASSGGYRLKPHAVDVRVDVDPVHWFLSDARDTRSSYFLEDAATEFKVQGLELDWTCLVWDADLRSTEDGWRFRRFVGKRWIQLNEERSQRLLNAYRVLLTRARQGMVIVVPRGATTDNTREPAFYDGTYDYLTTIGIPDLPCGF